MYPDMHSVVAHSLGFNTFIKCESFGVEKFYVRKCELLSEVRPWEVAGFSRESVSFGIDLFSYSPPLYWWLSHFLILASLMSKRCSFIIVLTYVSLITGGIERLFVYLLAICVSSGFIICLNYLCWFFLAHTQKSTLKSIYP